jgi:hypothetical protein
MNRIFVAIIGLLAVVTSASADDLPMPTGPVVLTVTGQISNTNVGDTAVFDIAMLEALAGRATVTETPWTDGIAAFEGPLGEALLTYLGAEGDSIVVTALNDYQAEIPIADFLTWPVILATRMNGEAMSVREKGPIFVIYPFDIAPELYNEVYFGRSVWQVASIEVR